MEGIGSRVGRSNSRYGAAPVFSGPVRKWKKQWVHVSRSLSHHRTKTPSTLLLCRWTPLSSDNNNPDDQPTRKFRYSPIVVLDEKKKEVSEKSDDEASKTNQSTTRETSESDDITEKDIENLFEEETQESNDTQPAQENQSCMDLYLKGHVDNIHSDGDTNLG